MVGKRRGSEILSEVRRSPGQGGQSDPPNSALEAPFVPGSQLSAVLQFAPESPPHCSTTAMTWFQMPLHTSQTKDVFLCALYPLEQCVSVVSNMSCHLWSFACVRSN